MTTYKNYVNELSKKFGYHPTWEPSTKLSIGDIGILRNGVFERIDSISSLGIDIGSIQRKKSDDSVLEYQSNDCKTFSVNAGGEMPALDPIAIANADVVVSFGSEGGIYFKVESITTRRIKNQIELMNNILSKYNDGSWQKEWVVINELREAKSGVILYSASKNANVSFKANADIDISPKTEEAGETDEETVRSGVPNLKLVDINAGLDIVRSSGMSLKFVFENPITPFFKLLGIKKNWGGLGTAKVKFREVAKPEEAFTDVPPMPI